MPFSKEICLTSVVGQKNGPPQELQIVITETVNVTSYAEKLRGGLCKCNSWLGEMILLHPVGPKCNHMDPHRREAKEGQTTHSRAAMWRQKTEIRRCWLRRRSSAAPSPGQPSRQEGCSSRPARCAALLSLGLRPLPSGTGREYISVVLSYPGLGHLLWQP